MLGWFHALMPRDERFFDLFVRHSQAVVAGAGPDDRGEQRGRRGRRRLDAVRRIGRAVDEAGLYERVLVPYQE